LLDCKPASGYREEVNLDHTYRNHTFGNWQR
jgi:hypothetical protein